jgi:hypothetical protein
VTRKRLPFTVWLGVAAMAALGTWGALDWDARRIDTLGGRVRVEAPAWAAYDYAELCVTAGRCDRQFAQIRWFAVDSSALPAVICPGAVHQYREVWGCWEWETDALTLVRAAYTDTVIVRHELLHAALGPRYAGQHPCRFFTVAGRTLTPGQLCE